MKLRAALFVMLLSTAAHADDVALAEKFFQEAKSAYARGENGAAALAFEEAYRHAPRGAAIFNAAVAWEAAGDLPRAADDFAVAETRADLDDKKRAHARERLAKLETELGRLVVDGPKNVRVSVAHASEVYLPVVIHVRPGEHEVRVHRPDGSHESRSVKAEKGAVAKLEIAAPAEPLVEKKPTPKVDAPAPIAPSHAARNWGFVALGGAALAAGTAAFLGVSALHARDDYDASGHTDADARSRASGLRTGTNVAWVATGVLAVTGVVLIALPSSRSEPSTVGLSPFGVSLTTRF